MRHKKYNKLLTIKRREYDTDELGDKVLSESGIVAETWGSITPASGGRLVKYDQNIREDIVDIKCHNPHNWYPHKDQLVEWRGKSYQILDWHTDAREYELIIEAVKIEK